MDDRCEAWTAIYDNPNGHRSFGEDAAVAVAASPEGERVYVTGTSRDDDTSEDMATVAYDPATGQALWVSRYDGGEEEDDRARALASGPDGRLVYAAGAVNIPLDGGYHVYPSGGDYSVVAYDAATGAEAWSWTYDGPGRDKDAVESIVVSSDATRIYAAGWSEGEENPDVATAALDARTGEELWVSRYDGGTTERGLGVGLSPDGATVFVTGFRATLAYDSGHDDTEEEQHGGELLWAARDILADSWWPRVADVDVAPDGSTVFATGALATAGYDAATGARRWLLTHQGDSNVTSTREAGWSAALAPDGTRLYLAGWDWPASIFVSDAAALALDPATGEELWSKRYPDAWWAHVATPPTGSRVYVTDGDCATYAYDGASGEQVWTGRYVSPTSSWCDAMGLSPDGRRVFAAGGVDEAGGLATGNLFDYLTLAYEA